MNNLLSRRGPGATSSPGLFPAGWGRGWGAGGGGVGTPRKS